MTATTIQRRTTPQSRILPAQTERFEWVVEFRSEKGVWYAAAVFDITEEAKARGLHEGTRGPSRLLKRKSITVSMVVNERG